MSTAVRSTPQTRSQTKRGVTRTSSLAQQSSEIPQQTTFLTVVGTLVVFGLLSFGYSKYHKSIIQVPRLPSVTDRLIYTLQLQTYSLIPLAFSLVQVMVLRFLTGALNPLSGHEKLVDKPVRILTNSVEQLLFNFINLVILVTLISAENLYVIPFLVFVFTLGRISFVIGYTIHPKFRTFGSILTFFPSVVVFIVNLLYVSGVNKYLPLPATEHGARKTEL